jgi:hypothetical protein
VRLRNWLDWLETLWLAHASRQSNHALCMCALPCYVNTYQHGAAANQQAFTYIVEIERCILKCTYRFFPLLELYLMC